jgi:glycosyltransferase involved in cell wall biosynthesis
MLSLLFIDTERVWRGGQDQLVTLVGGLIARGHQVDLVCHPGSLLEQRAAPLGARIHRMSIRSEIGPISFFRLASLIRKIKPEILAFNTPRPIIIGNLASWLSPVKVRVVFRRVNFPLRNSPFTRWKYTMGIDCIVAISESIRSQLLLQGIPAGMIRTVYEGMDLSQFPPLNADSGNVGPIVVGTLAHLSTEKGIQYLIQAANLIPEVRERMRFVIVGDGDCRKELEQQVRECRLEECFQFAGFCSDTIRYLRRFDIFVLPSLSEGLSSAILSAMASFLPVVATNVGGIPELIRDGDNGLLVPPGNPEALAKAIDGLAGNASERIRMGNRGRARMEEQFTIEQKIENTDNLFRALLEAK